MRSRLEFRMEQVGNGWLLTVTDHLSIRTVGTQFVFPKAADALRFMNEEMQKAEAAALKEQDSDP